MKKIDVKKELKHLYNPSKKYVAVVDVPEMNFLMIDGQGDPNAPGPFQEAVEALYALAYAIKFMVKKGELSIDYGVMPLEGLWWADDMSRFSVEHKENWKWTLMIMQPEFITAELVAAATDQVKQKKNPPGLPGIRFQGYAEGKAAHIMHIGPFSEEGPTVEKLHTYIRENGSKRRGLHHEIYLSDIRRAAPQKWRTIVRQPMQ